MNKSNKMKSNKCVNCTYWRNKQSELNYNTFVGICVMPQLKFDTKNGRAVSVLDRDNLSKKCDNTHHFENQSIVVPVGVVEHSRYALVTEETFGCNNFKTK